MDLSTFTPYLIALSDLLFLPACLLAVGMSLFMPWMLVATGFTYMGIELHYYELTRVTDADWDEPIYATISRPVESSPIWEQVQPEWRVSL